jgi:alpha-ketoglutarate-dependent taurine dioxygenase
VEGEVVRESDDRALGGPLFPRRLASTSGQQSAEKSQSLSAADSLVSKAVFRSPVVNLHPYALQSGFFVKFRKKTHARHFPKTRKLHILKRLLRRVA